MQKIKDFMAGERGKNFLTILIVVLVGLAGFGLGRLSNQDNSQNLKIEYGNQAASPINSLTSETQDQTKTPSYLPSTSSASKGNYFASSRGQKYYPVTCSAGKTIKIENRVYFENANEAEQAGYELSTSCQ